MSRNRLTARNFFKKRSQAVYSDFAPWVSSLILELEHFKEHEFHIVSPHRGMARMCQEFNLDGIHYHFYNPDHLKNYDSFMTKTFPNSMNHYLLNRYLVKRIIRKIKPDIVNLIGAENPYYSSAALDIKGIPIYLTVQTVYSNDNAKQLSGSLDPYRAALEKELYRRVYYVGCEGKMHYDLIRKMNPEITIFKMLFPYKKPALVEAVEPEFDFVNFAGRMGESKGGLDALEALAHLKRQGITASLNLVGRAAPEYQRKMETFVKDNGLSDQVTFSGYFKEHIDMFRQVKKSRFALLPIKLDVISSTIIEAAHLGLPIVTYITSGTPYLNRDGEAVLLSNIGDIKGLANNMKRLLENPELGETLSNAATRLVDKDFDNRKSTKSLLDNFAAILEYERNGTPIPEEMLFNPDDYPDYKGVYGG
ncbi:MAG TPA: glycosyltransferase family 4 protein [Candidatus Cloacimonetes bacterium]|nr:glycosyltransferase family 4 protein [Candidatus Cloacimonadota bacterium]